jgi:chaperonin GroEL (HSP60 family)
MKAKKQLAQRVRSLETRAAKPPVTERGISDAAKEAGHLLDHIAGNLKDAAKLLQEVARNPEATTESLEDERLGPSLLETILLSAKHLDNHASDYIMFVEQLEESNYSGMLKFHKSLRRRR